MKDEKFNNLDRNSKSIILTDLMYKWETYTKEQCEAALMKVNPLCIFSNKKYRLCSSGYSDTIGVLFTK